MTSNEQKSALIALLHMCNGMTTLDAAIDSGDRDAALRACDAVIEAVRDLQHAVGHGALS